MEGTIGEIRMFGGNFAPRSWAFCSGQLMSIAQNSALFSILGTTFGGDGRTTFGLPDMRGRVSIHAGNGPGLTDRRLGQKGGEENVTLLTQQMPSHNHVATPNLSGTVGVIEDDGTTADAAGNVLANATSGEIYHTGTPDATLGGGVAVTGSVAVSHTGGGQPHDNMQPWLAVNYIICLFGVFPSRS